MDCRPTLLDSFNPDWRKNEAGYWAVRDQLLPKYQGQWIGFADGSVVATASRPLDVFLAIRQSGKYAFVARVGLEDEPWYRIRRVNFSYDTSYPSTALPVIAAEFLFRGPAGEVVINP